MVALRVNVHTPHERIAISIPSTLYPTEASAYLLQLLRQHSATVLSEDSLQPTYVEHVTDSPWYLSHLSQGPLHEDRTLFDNGVRDGDTLLFSNELHTAGVVRTRKIETPIVAALTDTERLSELRSSGRLMSLIGLGVLTAISFLAAAHPQWWFFGASAFTLLASTAFAMVVAYRRGKEDHLLLSGFSFALAVACGLNIPSVNPSLTFSVKALIAVSLLVFFILLHHVLRLASLRNPSIASLLMCAVLVIVGLVLAEFTDMSPRSIGSTGLLLGCILLLGAARFALWIARVKIPITALMDIDLPLFSQSTIDEDLHHKIDRARQLHSILTLCAVYLTLVSTVAVVQQPWTLHYDSPNAWQWTLLALVSLAYLSASFHAVYHNHTRWLLGCVQALFVILALTLGLSAHPVAAFGMLCGSLLVMGSVWLWVTQWSITPIVQKVIEVIEIIMLAIALPVGIVANGLIPLLLSL